MNNTINVYRWEGANGFGPREQGKEWAEDVIARWTDEELPSPYMDGCEIASRQVCATTRHGHSVWWTREERREARKHGMELVRYTLAAIDVVIGFSGHQCFFCKRHALKRTVLVMPK